LASLDSTGNHWVTCFRVVWW